MPEKETQDNAAPQQYATTKALRDLAKRQAKQAADLEEFMAHVQAISGDANISTFDDDPIRHIVVGSHLGYSRDGDTVNIWIEEAPYDGDFALYLASASEVGCKAGRVFFPGTGWVDVAEDTGTSVDDETEDNYIYYDFTSASGPATISSRKTSDGYPPWAYGHIHLMLGIAYTDNTNLVYVKQLYTAGPWYPPGGVVA